MSHPQQAAAARADPKQSGKPPQPPAAPTTQEKMAVSGVMSWNREQIELLKRTVCKGASDDELAIFGHVAKRMGLDPFARQIHAVKRWDSQLQKEVMAIQIGIDGFRLTSDRTKLYDGMEGPFWCGADGAWKEVWLEKEPPVAAKAIGWRKDAKYPFIAIARYDAYVQKKRDGNPNHMWATNPSGQLAKCAEALMHRKMFPAELSGVHAEEEMEHLDSGEPRKPIAMPTRKSTGQPAQEGQVVEEVSEAADPQPEQTGDPQEFAGEIENHAKPKQTPEGIRFGFKIGGQWYGTVNEQYVALMQEAQERKLKVVGTFQVRETKDGPVRDVLEVKLDAPY